jgi:hypothetical protein
MTAPQSARLQKFSALARSENGYDPSQMKGNDALKHLPKHPPKPTPPEPITVEDLVKDLYQAVQPDPALPTEPTEPTPRRRRKPPEKPVR